MNLQEQVTLDQLVAQSGVRIRTLQRMWKRGGMPGRFIGGMWLVPRGQALRAIKRQRGNKGE